MRGAALFLLLLSFGCGREGAPQGEEPSVLPSPARTAASVPETPSVTAAPASTATPAPTGSPAAPAGCRNSTSASCGPLRFEPRPDDDEVTVRVTATPASPEAGDRVTFTLRATDPDSSEVSLGTYDFGPRGTAHIERAEPSSCARGYGPWDPPPARAGSSSTTLSHTYGEAGRYEATFTFTSESGGARLPGDDDGRCVDPYGSSGKADITIVVR